MSIYNNRYGFPQDHYTAAGFLFNLEYTTRDNPNRAYKGVYFDAGFRVNQTWIGSTKNASQHKARHSFAQRAEEKEVHPKVLQKMYRHESILTTMKYQSNFSFQKADEAIDAVVDF